MVVAQKKRKMYREEKKNEGGEGRKAGRMGPE
jgi:hypothetical protein